MIRGQKILVTIFLFLFSISITFAHGGQKELPGEKGSKQVEQQEQKIEKKDIAPASPNLDNDQWRKEKIRYRIPRDLEIGQPLITYKEQQVA
jgi:hypothetical protein